MRFWYRVCQFFFFGGILSALLGLADHLLGLGIWHGAYPPVHAEANGQSSASSFGEFMLTIGITVGVAFLGLMWLGRKLEKRAMEAYFLLEAMREQGVEEGREQIVGDADESA